MCEQAEQTAIFNYLYELGCCLNCCVRYFCDKTIDFSDLNGYLTDKQLLQLDESKQVLKRAKSNPCIVCLGLLQNECLEAILSFGDINLVNQYDSKLFTVSISYPPIILLREHSMRLHLEEKFPKYFTDENQEIPLNRVWKMFVKSSIGKAIDKTFQSSDICNFSINIQMEYANNENELSVLQKMQPKIFETRTIQHRKYNGEMFTRKGVLSALNQTRRGVFNMYSDVPPKVPTNYLFCKAMECKHDPVYIAGRYCKYSRELSQSPWIIDGVKTMETSVQEIIFENIRKCLEIPEENLKFSSSGREDCDVRCLGRGRPFYIEMLDPKRTNFEFAEFRQIEQLINASKIIEVKDLQMVNRSDLRYIKEGEATKTKNYIALCTSQQPLTDDLVNKINNHGKFTISQKTPIRVLHRRPLAVREKTIHEMTAHLIPKHPNLFEVHVLTQAGTYVKEFIHGDFGRTKPSIGDIINIEVDILALDVVSINLDWPEAIDYEKSNNKQE